MLPAALLCDRWMMLAVSDPIWGLRLNAELAFVLLAVAIVGLLIEVATPGVGFGAVLGLALGGAAFIALAALDVNAIGLLLALLAAVLLTAGLFLHPGALQIAGSVALLLSGLTLFSQGAVHPVVLLPVVAAVGGGTSLLAKLVASTRGAPAYQGQAGTLVGASGVVRQGGNPGDELKILVAGSLWAARADVKFARGATVVVTAQDGLQLRVGVSEPEEKRTDDGKA